ncbi:DUF2281 domain-containing protein [Mucilaginibacter myungsuensis]|uniref:DUF2281 domain-containing protein n=1 Tax=Mucilaginibacter myungsuensis TaxID=649104 RepID=A0A929KXH1_9SPHI|nr:DUF2281 domain-containing protein [Mucilaginibacter myungsuensis]MBE9660704.1 DUF2281 domain-containing protein [Mucilaginibacter myungsuensis]MDN3600749.1 hypothetical protein [Mucilaginibacter myungsuensis]
MVRTIVKPSSSKISIDVPEELIGKDVEVIAFAIDEPLRVKPADDLPFTHFATEQVLAKEWLTKEEDAAWQDL